MKLRWLHIKGFRSIREISFEVDDFLCFIGQNNHGKSNIFHALDLFLSSGTKGATSEIFFRTPTETAREVIIEARFEDLSQAEMDKLRPWTVNGILTVAKKYWIDDNKPQVLYEALMRLPKDEWLQEDFEKYNDRSAVSELPIAEFLPESGRITKQIYKEAIQEYIKTHPSIEYTEERRENPAGYKQVLDGYLPEFYLVPAVRDITEETKTSGTALLSRLLNVIIGRIARQNPAFQRLEDTIQEIKTLIEGKTPADKLAEIRELEDKLKRELTHWDIGLSIGVEAPEVERVFQLGTSITLDDGLPTGADEKGHGLQRYLIFALMRVWAAETRQAETGEDREIRERAHIFAFEEPELFLHPQMCRATYESLRQISKIDQTLVCTHSPHFIDMEDYRSLVIVRKPNLETGTNVQRIQEELFEGEKKRQFNMVRFFNPDRNELFFARKVVLVEGATEKAVLPLLARRIGVFDHKVSIIDCGSKFNLILFMGVLNAFCIPYLVIHDEDPIDSELQPGGSKHDPDKLEEAKRVFEENQRIREACDSQLGSVKEIPRKFEKLLGISENQIERLGKPLAAVEKYANENIEILEDIKELVGEVYK
jgi:putative ATP-dependent endonuclease of OLD family